MRKISRKPIPFILHINKISIFLKVLVFPSQKNSGASLSSSNVWLHVIGSLAETPKLMIPRGVIHFSFWAVNLGVITSLRLGHDNTGTSPNWLVEHVLIKNEFTGMTYKFNCGRWLGTNIDDGSTERYMVGYVKGTDDMDALVNECALPPSVPCPATNVRSVDPETEIVEIQVNKNKRCNKEFVSVLCLHIYEGPTETRLAVLVAPDALLMFP